MVYDKKLNQPNKKFKTLYLLHGIFGNYTDWVYDINYNYETFMCLSIL